MTGESSEPGSGPGQHPPGANPDEPTAGQSPSATSDEQPRSADQQPPPAKPRRSGEFWLALASTAVALVIGVTGFVVNYELSGRQIRAESDRVAASFTREQRRAAYTDFLSALNDLRREEFKLADAFEVTSKTRTMGDLEARYREWETADAKYFAADNAAKLMASHDVSMTLVFDGCAPLRLSGPAAPALSL